MNILYIYIVITCGFPIYQSNVNGDVNGSLVGAVAEFTCEDGLVLSGASIIFCQEDGTWSAESPVCRGEIFRTVNEFD